MASERIIRVVDVVGSRFCIASDDGEKVFTIIKEAVEQGESLTLSFADVEDLTTAFLNTAIGQLYGRFTSEQIRANLSIIDIEPDDIFLLQRVIERAKEYFADPVVIENLERTIARELGYGDE